MAILSTVTQYTAAARELLQDETAPYRYSDNAFIFGLNLGLLEARKLRPDLFLGRSVPAYAAGDTVVFDEMYRSALLYYMAGHVQLRDEEDTQDARAAGFLSKFVAQLMGLA